mgnify:CR=1 FL=1
MIRKFLAKIGSSPEIKTIIFILSVLISGILCSGFITEITKDGKLDWTTFYKAVTFWLLIGYSFIIYLYNRFIYRFEKNILKYLDENYCKAYIVNACLPEITERYKQELRSGKKTSEMIDISKELKKLLK